MIWKFSLYNLNPEASVEELLENERQLLTGYESYLRVIGQRYVG